MSFRNNIDIVGLIGIIAVGVFAYSGLLNDVDELKKLKPDVDKILKIGVSVKKNSNNISQLQVNSTEIPTGTIFAYWGNSAPVGYLMCNGQNIPKKHKFEKLLLLVGDKTPNLSDMFLRGKTAGRLIGHEQEDSFKAHHHHGGYVSHLKSRYGNEKGTMLRGSRYEFSDSQAISGDEAARTNTVGGQETRPKNIAVNFIIRI